MIDGMTAEIDIVGNDGVLGVALVLDGHSRSNRAIVQVAGDAWRLAGAALHAEGQPGGRAPGPTHPGLANGGLSSTPLDPAAAVPGLLLFSDRTLTDTMLMTHEYLGQMLDIRRASVTTEAQQLQEVGSIRYHRGRLTLLDRAGWKRGWANVIRSSRRNARGSKGCMAELARTDNA